MKSIKSILTKLPISKPIAIISLLSLIIIPLATFAVSDTTPPSVSIITPINNTAVSGVSGIKISATDNLGVTKVELYVDGILKSSSTASPFNLFIDTAGLTNGTHTLLAKAYDAAGNIGTSATVTITTSNGTVTQHGDSDANEGENGDREDRKENGDSISTVAQNKEHHSNHGIGLGVRHNNHEENENDD